ncbi:MAG: hypothetical protein ACI9K2_006232 [Myxococcota bacterium]|jgi:hypothetical protein
MITLLATAALAWGPTGHRTVGLIAERHIQRRTARALSRLMPEESLARASTWPDHIRSDDAMLWVAPLPPALAELAREHHKQWHYLNADPGQSLVDAQAAQPENLVVGLERFVALAADTTADPEARRIAIRWIVHLVGDAHQPFHAGSAADWGGNKIAVTWFDRPSNLHRVWDEDLIAHTELSFTELAAFVDHASAEDIATWTSAAPVDWLAESQALVPGAVPTDPALSWAYAYTHTGTVERRLVQAGVRLAGVLDRVFGR